MQIDSVSDLVEAASNPFDSAFRHKSASGRPVIGTPCSWVPAEIVEALGASLFRIPLFAGKIAHAGVHLQSASCGYAKGLLELALTGELDFLDAVIIPNLCDTIQNIADVWKVAVRKIPSATIYVPVNLKAAGAVQFLEAELERLARKLSGLLGKEINDNDLDEAIAAWKRRREVMWEYYGRRKELARRVSMTEIYALLFASDLLGAAELERFSAMLAEGKTSEAGEEGVEVFLVGSAVPFSMFFRILDELSIHVVDDYICGGRAFFGFEETIERRGKESPLGYLARLMLSRTEGAVKVRPNEGSGMLFDRIRQSGAREVLWVTQKFCDPWGWHLSILKDKLEKEGVRVFDVEIGGVEGEEGYLKNRLEAFAEMSRMGPEFY